eukprot:TRINITY_DN27990_c0_g1_i1.p1 TRINITY_DN27990_c0_g1~~TRINITY_DN27990_c0_g1_i1.p1  ORF type:complete len:114 (-),score=4.49 TRINITY_DN27990_c0_g1_i1:510-851(-)
MTIVRLSEAGDGVRRRVADPDSEASGHARPSASHQATLEPGSTHVMVPRRVAWFLAAVLLALVVASYINAKNISVLQRRLEEIEKGASHKTNPNSSSTTDTGKTESWKATTAS